MSHLPERINAMKLVSYDVAGIIEAIIDLNDGEITAEDITLDEILNLISGWADEDMSNPQNKVIFQDENGEDL
jgi:hypothetical protein